MIKNIFILLLIFLAEGCSSASQTFWLTNISSPDKVPSGYYPYLEDPADKTGDVAALTISDGRLIFNGELCNYDIDRIKKFSINRVLADEIDDVGGEKVFGDFVRLKLKSDFKRWSDQIFLKNSKNFLDNRSCKLLQSSSIYMSGNELILWDTMFFYRFLLGREFKY